MTPDEAERIIQDMLLVLKVLNPPDKGILERAEKLIDEICPSNLSSDYDQYGNRRKWPTLEIRRIK